MIETAAKKILTLCLITTDSQILLGYKKRGFGQGRWNGFGGKVHAGEAIDEAAERELIEESGLEPKSLKLRAVLKFHFENDPVELETYLFEVSAYNGDPIETEEMKPQWFGFSEIPFDQMWPDDRLWMPLYLAGKNFRGEFFFQDTNILTDYKLLETENLGLTER